MPEWTADDLDRIGGTELVQPAIDRAYRARYERTGGAYVPPMVTPEAVAATVRLLPA